MINKFYTPKNTNTIRRNSSIKKINYLTPGNLKFQDSNPSSSENFSEYISNQQNQNKKTQSQQKQFLLPPKAPGQMFKKSVDISQNSRNIFMNKSHNNSKNERNQSNVEFFNNVEIQKRMGQMSTQSSQERIKKINPRMRSENKRNSNGQYMVGEVVFLRRKSDKSNSDKLAQQSNQNTNSANQSTIQSKQMLASYQQNLQQSKPVSFRQKQQQYQIIVNQKQNQENETNNNKNETLRKIKRNSYIFSERKSPEIVDKNKQTMNKFGHELEKEKVQKQQKNFIIKTRMRKSSQMENQQRNESLEEEVSQNLDNCNNNCDIEENSIEQTQQKKIERKIKMNNFCLDSVNTYERYNEYIDKEEEEYQKKLEEIKNNHNQQPKKKTYIKVNSQNFKEFTQKNMQNENNQTRDFVQYHRQVIKPQNVIKAF